MLNTNLFEWSKQLGEFIGGISIGGWGCDGGGTTTLAGMLQLNPVQWGEHLHE